MNISNKASVLTFFPKVFYLNFVKEINFKKIYKEIKKEEFIEFKIDEKRSYSSHVKSPKNFDILNKNYLKNIKKKINNEFNNFKNNYLKYENTSFKITTSWLTKSKKGESSRIHKHRNSMYSGILYLQVDDLSGDISFENHYTDSFNIIPTKYNIYNSEEYLIKPKNNMIIFFPSDTHHRILENKSNNTRYSIAFNLMPSTKIGEVDSTYEYI